MWAALSIFSSVKVWLIAGAALVVVIFWFRLEAVTAQRDAAEARYDTLDLTHKANLFEIQHFKSDLEKSAAAVKREIARHQKEKQKIVIIKERIFDAPEKGCVGPAVMLALDGLRDRDKNHNQD